jgi:hypothetical protein
MQFRLFLIVTSALLTALFLVSCSADTREESVGTEVSEANLLGTWVRPDGGYILQIRSAHTDGKLNAGYFNPRPVNIGKAAWRRAGSILKVEVVLDDTNYWGSTYSLVYQEEEDRLAGVYFQAVQGQNYQVVFVRRQEGGD